MKWLSVKKYKPYFASSTIFVRIEDKKTGHNNIHVAYFQDGNWLDEHCKWNDKTQEWNSLDVTHFCIPDPIPVEDEE